MDGSREVNVKNNNKRNDSSPVPSFPDNLTFYKVNAHSNFFRSNPLSNKNTWTIIYFLSHTCCPFPNFPNNSRGIKFFSYSYINECRSSYEQISRILFDAYNTINFSEPKHKTALGQVGATKSWENCCLSQHVYHKNTRKKLYY